MTIREAIELFETEMNNEIFHSTADNELQDSLLESVKRVKQLVIDTCESGK